MSIQVSDDEDYRSTISHDTAAPLSNKSAKHRLGVRPFFQDSSSFVGDWWINLAVVKSAMLRHEFSKVAIEFERKLEAKGQELSRVVPESNRVLEKQKLTLNDLKAENSILERKLKKKSKACKKLRELAFSDSD